MSLAILLRNCSHASRAGSDGTAINYVSTSDPYNQSVSSSFERYALQADSVSIQIQKGPTHLSVPKTVRIIDLNTAKPVITITGTIDNVGQDTTNTTQGFESMTAISVTRKHWDDATTTTSSAYTNETQTYYVPYKNALEDAIYRFAGKMNDSDKAIELEIGDANHPRFNTAADPHSDTGSRFTIASGSNFVETGGGVYVVAINNARFDMEAGAEDRWNYQLQFIAEYRKEFKH